MPPPGPPPEPAEWSASLPEGAFRSALVHAREEIRQGNIGRLWLGVRFERPFRGDARDAFFRLPEGGPRLFLRLPEATLLATLREDPAEGFLAGGPAQAARELLAELEPAPRGYQGGSFVMAGFGGGLRRFGVERSLQILGGRALASAALLVEADSDPSEKWDELLRWVDPLRRALDGQ